MGFLIQLVFVSIISRSIQGCYDILLRDREEVDVVKKIKILSLILLLSILIFLLKKFIEGNISSVEDFQLLMKQYGVLGPIVLILIQAIQVVLPIIPGYFGCIVGAVSYGTIVGFICNYIGICVGSIMAFFLAEKFGKDLVVEMFSVKTYDRWTRKIAKKKSYDVFLFIATLLPLFPDDFLCYFSGLIHMNRKRFICIILLGKPWCILAYSIIFGMI